jgi:hypothetical protein
MLGRSHRRWIKTPHLQLVAIRSNLVKAGRENSQVDCAVARDFLVPCWDVFTRREVSTLALIPEVEDRGDFGAFEDLLLQLDKAQFLLRNLARKKVPHLRP